MPKLSLTRLYPGMTPWFFSVERAADCPVFVGSLHVHGFGLHFEAYWGGR